MNSLKTAVSHLINGEHVVLIDDLDSKEAGFIFCSAQLASAESICKLIALTRGVVISPISEVRLKELYLHPSQHQQDSLGLAVEARSGVSTGVSAADRAQTLRTLATSTRPRSELVIPGHIFPHLSKEGGVLVRACASEAAVDLLEIAQLAPVAALARCLDENGSSMDVDNLLKLTQTEGIPVVRISEVLCERLATESLVEKITTAKLPIEGMENFSAIPFRSKIDGAEHIAFIMGKIDDPKSPPLVRVQSEERIADLFGSGAYQSRQVMNRALAKINEEGSGVFVYIRHPRRGIVAKQVKEISSMPVTSPSRAGQLREYGIGTQILKSLGIRSLRLLSTNVRPITGVENFQIEISSQVEF